MLSCPSEDPRITSIKNTDSRECYIYLFDRISELLFCSYVYDSFLMYVA